MEYDYAKELLYHQTPLGFRLKIQDILILGLIGVVFSLVVLYDLLRFCCGKVRRPDVRIEVRPLQEIGSVS